MQGFFLFVYRYSFWYSGDMFTKLGQFLDKDDEDKWHVKRPPMRYTNVRGEDFVVMAARHYEEITGEDSNRLQAYEVFDSINDTDESELSAEKADSAPRQEGERGHPPVGGRKEDISEPVETDGGFRATREAVLGANLADLSLEDEIHLEDLPL